MNDTLGVAGKHPGRAPGKGMVWVPGGRFLMGSERFYPEERPVRAVSVDGFWIDEHPVTVAEFRRFVKATGHVTMAERAPDPDEYPDADRDLLHPGSLVFRQTGGPVDLRDVSNWWSYVVGANWRHPEGPGSTLHGRERHPVTHVTAEDVDAYAAWAGKALPTEAEWEFAARGGLEGATYTWGDDFAPKGRMMANTWQGEFPWQNLESDGFARTSPVKSFPPNGYGLYDMAGNVWEWTSDHYSPATSGNGTTPAAPHHPDPRPACSLVKPERTSRAASSRAARTCAPPTTACAIARPPARGKPSTPPPATSDSAASSGPRVAEPTMTARGELKTPRRRDRRTSSARRGLRRARRPDRRGAPGGATSGRWRWTPSAAADRPRRSMACRRPPGWCP